MHWISNAKYLEEYKLELTFNDNIVKIVDLNKFVGGDGVFKLLQNLDYFKNFRIDNAGNTICWENGADICPYTLYSM